jgi:hypothetical protein
MRGAPAATGVIVENTDFGIPHGTGMRRNGFSPEGGNEWQNVTMSRGYE